MKRGNRNNSYERGGQIELAKAMGNVAKKGDKEINEGRDEIKSIRKDITVSENQINNLESGIDREIKSIKDNENNIKEIKKDLGGIYKTVQDAKKQKAKFAKGGEVKYAIYEDYDGNDIKTEKFDKGRDEDDIFAPSGYNIADFDEDDDGVVYVRFQQEEEFAKGGDIRRSPIRKLAFEMYNKEYNELSSKEQKKVEDKRDELMDKDYNSYKKKYYAKGGEVGKTYEIKGADVTFYEDSYEEGEKDQFHSYYLGENDFPYKTKFSNKKDLFETLNDFVSYADMKEEDFYVDEDTIQTSALVKHEKGSDWDEFSAPTEKEKELWKKGEMKLYSAQFVFPYEVYKKEKLEFEKGGQTDDVIMIKIGGDKKYPYYIKKIDTTHMSMANSKDGVDLVTPSHILQHRGESYYDDVRSWLKGGTSPNGKSYDSDYYAKGGKVKTYKMTNDTYENIFLSRGFKSKRGSMGLKFFEHKPSGTFITYDPRGIQTRVIIESPTNTIYEGDTMLDVIKALDNANVPKIKEGVDDYKDFEKGGELEKNEEHNTMLIGGIAGILLGIFLGRK